jgi:hypothetical protein
MRKLPSEKHTAPTRAELFFADHFYTLFLILTYLLTIVAIYAYYNNQSDPSETETVVISSHPYDSTRILNDAIRGEILVVYFNKRPTICYEQDGTRGWLEIYNVDGWLIPRTNAEHENFLHDPNCRTVP